MDKIQFGLVIIFFALSCIFLLGVSSDVVCICVLYSGLCDGWDPDFLGQPRQPGTAQAVGALAGNLTLSLSPLVSCWWVLGWRLTKLLSSSKDLF